MISWWGALIGLALAIFLILRKLDPVYSLLLGAIVGAVIGGAGLEGTINILVKGEQSVMGTVLRVISSRNVSWCYDGFWGCRNPCTDNR